MGKPDATQGSVTKGIFTFAIPLFLSSLLQNLFSIADKAVLGNIAGSVAVASVAATTTVTSLIINGAVGLSTGTGIVLARFVGQKNREMIRSTVDTSLIASIVFGFLVAAAGIALAPAFLTMTHCPEECYQGALIYMRIIIATAPATLLYNYGSAILRTVGDTQKTLHYIAIAGVVNVVLNLVLCLVLTQKVIAVAVATAASNLISAALVLHRLCRTEDCVRVDLSRLSFDFGSLKRIVRFGIPASISNLVLPLGNLQITTAINSFGPDAIAGHAAALSVETVSYAVSGGFGSAAMTFIGQNIGAGNVDRVRKVFRRCLTYNFLISGTLGVLSYLTGEFWIGIIVGMSSTGAIAYGMARLLHVALFLFIHAISTILTNTLAAFGYPIFTSLTNIAFNLVFRVIWMQFVYPHSQTFNTIMLCYTVAWILNLIFYVIATWIVYRRYVRTGVCKNI